ncbi:MAG: putative PDDEXK endonuclease [bacterium]
MVNSIQKGKRFERMMCKILSAVLGAKFYRVANSGALATQNKELQNRIFRGDIFTEDERYKDIVFECKFRSRSITLSELFKEASNGSMINDFLEQAWQEAGVERGEGTNWCLFVKTNFNNILMFTKNTDLLNKLSNEYIYFKGDDYDFYVGVV